VQQPAYSSVRVRVRVRAASKKVCCSHSSRVVAAQGHGGCIEHLRKTARCTKRTHRHSNNNTLKERGAVRGLASAHLKLRGA
jgi:hypothetical protein